MEGAVQRVDLELLDLIRDAKAANVESVEEGCAIIQEGVWSHGRVLESLFYPGLLGRPPSSCGSNTGTRIRSQHG